MFTYLLNNLNNQLRVASSWLFRVLTLALVASFANIILLSGLSVLYFHFSEMKPQKPTLFTIFIYLSFSFEHFAAHFAFTISVYSFSRVIRINVFVRNENLCAATTNCNSSPIFGERYSCRFCWENCQFLCAASKCKHINVCCWFCVLIYLFQSRD